MCYVPDNQDAFSWYEVEQDRIERIHRNETIIEKLEDMEDGQDKENTIIRANFRV